MVYIVIAVNKEYDATHVDQVYSVNQGIIGKSVVIKLPGADFQVVSIMDKVLIAGKVEDSFVAATKYIGKGEDEEVVIFSPHEIVKFGIQKPGSYSGPPTIVGF